jgi:hypothetical protein
MSITDLTTASDTLEGVAAIAEFLGKSERRTHYLVENKRLPAFKLGGRWHMRKSTYQTFIERLEAAVEGV